MNGHEGHSGTIRLAQFPSRSVPATAAPASRSGFRAEIAVGFVIGTLIPSTRAENERLGEVSDRVVDAAKDTASEAVDRGKQVAQEATQAAVDTAKEAGKEQTQELTSTLQERAQGATGDSPSSAAAWTPPPP